MYFYGEHPLYLLLNLEIFLTLQSLWNHPLFPVTLLTIEYSVGRKRECGWNWMCWKIKWLTVWKTDSGTVYRSQIFRNNRNKPCFFCRDTDLIESDIKSLIIELSADVCQIKISDFHSIFKKTICDKREHKASIMEQFGPVM